MSDKDEPILTSRLMGNYYECIALKYECDELRWSLRRAEAEAEDLRRKLAEAQEANQWYRPSEKLPLEPHEWNGYFEYLTCIGYWPNSGVLATEYWLPFGDAPFQWKAVVMNKFGWEWRTPPLYWRYLPVPPASTKEQATE